MRKFWHNHRMPCHPFVARHPFLSIMRGCLALLAAAAAATLPGCSHAAAPAPPEMRTASDAEITSFDAFYRERYSAAPSIQPAFAVTRQHGRRDWSVGASVDSAPQRGLGPLCRMRRMQFELDPRAPRERRWRSDSSEQHFVWIDRAASCRTPTAAVALLQRLPDAELAPLLEQNGGLLLRARLLFAGNTSCAPQRSLTFKLAAIGVGAPPGGVEDLYQLVFESDRNSQANVWVKKRGQELNAWAVACSIHQGSAP